MRVSVFWEVSLVICGLEKPKKIHNAICWVHKDRRTKQKRTTPEPNTMGMWLVELNPHVLMYLWDALKGNPRGKHTQSIRIFGQVSKWLGTCVLSPLGGAKKRIITWAALRSKLPLNPRLKG